jgi:hypothetical protein
MPLFFSPYSNNLLWNRLLLFFFTDLIPQIRKRDGLCLSLNFWYQSIRRENKQRPPHSLSLDPQRKLLEHTSIFIYFFADYPPTSFSRRAWFINSHIPVVGLFVGPAQLPAFHQARLTMRFISTFKVTDSFFEELLLVLKIFCTVSFCCSILL